MEFRAIALLFLLPGCVTSLEDVNISKLFANDTKTSLQSSGILDGICKQHSSCELCQTAGCGWCPKSNQCQGSTSLCDGEANLKNSTCWPEVYNHTGFNREETYRMMRYSFAAYYQNPKRHGLPDHVQVVKTFKYKLGVWDSAFGFVALDETAREIVLAFRGSETLTQLMVEILYHSLVPWKGDKQVRVNEFFMWAADDLLPQITPVLQDLQQKCGDCRLMATGHSLGASMAMIAAYNISFWSPRTPILWTFGQPRSSNGAFARMVEKQLPVIFRVVNAADPVPHIPLCTRKEAWCYDGAPGGYYHAGTEIWFPRGDYKNNVMCNFRACVGAPHSEDASCSDHLSFPEAAAVLDHHRYWDVLKKGFCGGDVLVV